MPNSGDIEVEVTLGPLCSSKYEWSKSEDAYEIEHVLKELLKRSNMIDLTRLCIQEGEFAFRLRVSILCLSHAGNLVDACVQALTAALLSTLIPAVKVDNDRVVVDESIKPSPLVLNKTPISVTIGIFEDFLIIDPSAEEENYLEGKFTAVLSGDGNPLYVTHYVNRRGFVQSQHESLLALCGSVAQGIRRDLNW